jgi:hypothetical protein
MGIIMFCIGLVIGAQYKTYSFYYMLTCCRPIDFELQLGGKCQDPQELTQVSDWGSGMKPTTLQLER